MPAHAPLSHFLAWTRDVTIHAEDLAQIARRQGVLEAVSHVPTGMEGTLRAELGIPLNTELCRFTISSPLGLQGYLLDGIGAYLPHIVDWLFAVSKGQF